MKNSVYDAPAAYTFYKTFTVSFFRKTTVRSVLRIFYNFFFKQFCAAFLPGKMPVTQVDHPLDAKVPFTPSWVTIYLDFVFFWIRMLAFLLRTYRHKAYNAVREFIASMGNLYAYASKTYQKNMSTTKRPFYIARPRFFLIHLLDPHLMCVPSLHVMVAIRTYTMFRKIVTDMGDAEKFAPQIEEIKQGALAITRAILYVKQHSVNCIPAALYAMTCYDYDLFTPAEAEYFANLLFTAAEPYTDEYTSQKKRPANYGVRPAASPRIKISAADLQEIRDHILSLYRRYLSEKDASKNWDEPILKFLRSMPRVR